MSTPEGKTASGWRVLYPEQYYKDPYWVCPRKPPWIISDNKSRVTKVLFKHRNKINMTPWCDVIMQIHTNTTTFLKLHILPGRVIQESTANPGCSSISCKSDVNLPSQGTSFGLPHHCFSLTQERNWESTRQPAERRGAKRRIQPIAPSRVSSAAVLSCIIQGTFGKTFLERLLERHAECCTKRRFYMEDKHITVETVTLYLLHTQHN